MNTNPIGILDSGVGGLTVWQQIHRELPNESTFYIADSLNCPYGSRTQEEVYHLTLPMIRFLLNKQVKVIVIACNTITVSCIDRLRKEFPQVPILGTVPVVKKAAESSKTKRIGILATGRTAQSLYSKHLIETYASECVVTTVGTNKLVPLIEEGILSGENLEEILIEVLHPFKKAHIDTLALACTHYPLVSESIQAILGEDVALLDPSPAIARHLRRILTAESLENQTSNASSQFFTTGKKESMEIVLKQIGSGEERVEKMSLVARVSRKHREL